MQWSVFSSVVSLLFFPLLLQSPFLSSAHLHSVTSASSPTETLSGHFHIQPQHVSFSETRDLPGFPKQQTCRVFRSALLSSPPQGPLVVCSSRLEIKSCGVNNYTLVCGCLCVCGCMYALRIVQTNVSRCINTLIVLLLFSYGFH